MRVCRARRRAGPTLGRPQHDLPSQTRPSRDARLCARSEESMFFLVVADDRDDEPNPPNPARRLLAGARTLYGLVSVAGKLERLEQVRVFVNRGRFTPLVKEPLEECVVLRRKRLLNDVEELSKE